MTEAKDGLLKARHIQILRHLALGLTNRQIANELGLSEGYVKVVLTRVYNKIGMSNRVEAAKWLETFDAVLPGKITVRRIKRGPKFCKACGESLRKTLSFASIIKETYRDFPHLVPFVGGDRARVLGQESAEAFARRKWEEQSAADKHGSKKRRGKLTHESERGISARRHREQTAGVQIAPYLQGRATVPRFNHRPN